MSMEEGPETDLAASHRHNHLLDWFEDSFITSLLEDPYTELSSQEWWNDEEIHTGLQMPATVDGNSSVPAERPDLSKKRKQPASAQRRACEEDGEAQRKKKPGGSDGSKDARWAEQLLNSCVAAAGAGNLSRVQHLLFVLRELASPSGDANQRLASHGLRAISGHLASLGAALPPLHATAAPPTSYATAERQLFGSAVIKFHEASPWFTLPNALANAAIIHALESQRPRTRPLHVIDIGVSHGMQWPTLLDALTRRPGGPPPLVRITVAGSAAIPHGPFSSAPPGYDSSAHLLRYAKSIDLNLHIDRADSISSGHRLRSEDDDEETLVVCAQFRIGHACMEERTAILDAFRGLEPELVVLSEIDWEVRQQRGGNGFLAGFPGRAKLLWSFLDSTAAAVKGRESADRKVVEDEAAGWLEMAAEAEGAAEWRERMAAAGFREEGFAEEVVETGRTLLRKYDSNWEMRPPAAAAAEAAAGVGLWWKGQPVSFCSLWSIQGKS